MAAIRMGLSDQRLQVSEGIIVGSLRLTSFGSFSRFPRVKIRFVSVPKRDPKASYCEVRKSVRDSSGVLRTIEVVAVVKGVARAQAAVEHFTQRLTEEEKKAGASLDWDYTARRTGRK
jgi:hypothetical protein